MNRSPFTMLRGLLASALLAFSALAAAQVPVPPVLYFSAEVPVGEPTTTYAYLSNSNGFGLTGVSVQIPMPSGFSVTSAVSSDCVITSNSTTPGGVSIVLDVPSFSCSIYYDVTAGAPVLATVTATVTVASASQDSTGPFTSYQRGAIGASFSPGSVAPGAPSTLAITLTNLDPNHDFTADGGEGGAARIPIGAVWSSAVVTGTNPPGCATDGGFSVPGPPYIQDLGFGDGPELFFAATAPVGSSCAVLMEVVGTNVGSFTVPPVPTTVSTYYAPPYPWYGSYDSDPVAPATLNIGLAALSFTPARLDFPPIPPRGSSGPLEATLTNTGSAVVSLLGIQVLGSGFAVTNNCLATLAPGSNCSFLASFSAGAAGPYFAEVRVTTDAASLPFILPMAASVTLVPMGTLTADPPRLAFTEQVVGTTSAAQAVTITNSGDAAALIGAISATGDFTVVGSTCTSVSLAPGSTCTLNVAFKPTSVGTRSGQVTVPSNASNPVLAIGLTGIGKPVPAPKVKLSATALDFGERILGATATQAVTVTNAGDADLAFGDFSISGDFRLHNGCPATLVPTASCRLDVDFLAPVPGTRRGEVRFGSNAEGSPHSVSLIGRGCRLAVTGRSFGLDCGR